MNLSREQEIVRLKLLEVAQQRKTVTYTEVAKWIGGDRQTVGMEILDTINRYEHSQKRPLLSALVVSSGGGFPSSGFFREAARLGRYKSSTDDEYVGRIKFLLEEVQQIYDTHRTSD